MGWVNRRADRDKPGDATLLDKSLRYWYTLRYLRPRQIFWRLWYRIYRPQFDQNAALSTRTTSKSWETSVPRAPSLLSESVVQFLNEEAEIFLSTIWNEPNYSKLWLYNLHYFDDLNAEDGRSRHVWHRRLIDRWIAENPPTFGNGWQPYPTSLRIVNWVKWILCGNAPTCEMHDCLALQARWLRRHLEYHILGNHLIANAKALCFAGLYFCGKEADAWYSKGIKIIKKQLKEQVLFDGGHFELSPMYHLIVLEDLLDLVQLLNLYNEPVPDVAKESIERMLVWSRVMRHPDGEIPFFNDAAFGIAGTPASVDEYAQRLGFRATEPQGALVYLWESGYVRITCGEATLIADFAAVGPDYLPGHAHADTLSFELSFGKQRIIVNGGTSVYGAGLERSRQRGTAAHSTVVIDGEDSSEVWGGFRVARRAKVRDLAIGEEEGIYWTHGEHDGYRRLSGAPVHRRELRLSNAKLQVVDEIRGSDIHQVEVFFHLAPDLVPFVGEDGAVEVRSQDTGALVCTLFSSESENIVLEESTWHPRFGVSVPAWQMRVQLEGSLPLKHECTLKWVGTS